MSTQRALVIVDVQNDFCEGGSLAVAGGAEVAARIANHVQSRGSEYAATVATADWHIDPGSHFSAEPDFVDSWPVHCVADSHGAEFHANFAPVLDHVDAVFHKGEYTAAYSGFEGHIANGDTTLGQWLRDRNITDLDVCGIATDYCVHATAADALAQGFTVTVFSDKVAGVDPEGSKQALAKLAHAGAHVS